MKKQVNIFNYFSGVQYLRDYFEEMKSGNPRLSLRSFAAKLGLDQSTLSRYFAGERHISSDKATDIALRLKLDECESQYLKLLFLLGDRGEKDLLEKIKFSFLFDRMNRSHGEDSVVDRGASDLPVNLKSHLIFECLKLAPLPSGEEIVKRTSKHCAISPEKVEQVIKSMEEKGLGEKESMEKISPICNSIFVETSAAEYHKEALQWGLKACDQWELGEEMEFQTCLLPIKKESREQILKALRHLSILLKEQAVEENADDIFLVSSFMVNLTKI